MDMTNINHPGKKGSLKKKRFERRILHFRQEGRKFPSSSRAEWTEAGLSGEEKTALCLLVEAWS
jgi:hypothetical protein